MIRPDGTTEVFGTIDMPLSIENGGTGVTDAPGIGQLLIGTGDGYRIGDITAGSGIIINKSETTFEISSDISNIELVMPSEFEVTEQSVNGNNQFVVTKENQSPNTVYAGPSGLIENQPAFRLLVEGDIPQLNTYKIIGLDEQIQSQIPNSLDNSTNIALSYDTNTNKFKADLIATGVVAGSYGSLSAIPTINVDENGRITSITNNIVELLSENIANLKETVEDYVGNLVKETDSIAVAYNDVLSELELSVKPEYLITTNVSESENTRAPTSQAIKLYVDEAIDAERDARITEDNAIIQSLSQIEEQVGNNLQEIISELYNPITAHKEVIALTPTLLNESIDLQADQMMHIMPNSVVAFVDRIGLFEGQDFTLDNGLNNKVALTLTPSARNFFDGTETLRVSYLTKIQTVYDRINSNREVITLTPSMLNQSIELQVQLLTHIMPNSVVAFADRVGLFEGFDFILSNGPNNKVVLNLTNEALPLFDGSETLRITYLTKI
jgi:hypothetical protein